MNRLRPQRASLRLDASDIRALPMIEIRAILRGAENLIGQGGRTLLRKIRRGSRSKDLLERSLEKHPSLGFCGDLDPNAVTARIDWTIRNGYLQINYSRRSPLLSYTQAGLEIEN